MWGPHFDWCLFFMRGRMGEIDESEAGTKIRWYWPYGPFLAISLNHFAIPIYGHLADYIKLRLFWITLKSYWYNRVFAFSRFTHTLFWQLLVCVAVWLYANLALTRTLHQQFEPSQQVGHQHGVPAYWCCHGQNINNRGRQQWPK